MKKTIVFLSCIIFLVACKKDKLQSYKTAFAGSWELRAYYGYGIFPTYAPGNGKIIVLGADGSFERRQHDTVTFKGNYYLDERKDCSGNDKQIFFNTNDSNFSGGIIAVVGDTLTISSSNCLADGGTSVYRRN